MNIETLECRNFRNYEELSLSLEKGVNLFTGENAQGKTNILEAVYLASTGKSHRSVKDREIIRFGQPEAHIRMHVARKTMPRRIDVHLRRNGTKGIAIDGVPLKKLSELFGTSYVVFFSPEDLAIIKDSPGERRRFMDIGLCQLDPVYASDLASYHRVVMQKNRLLKELWEDSSSGDTLDIWNEQLVRYGVPVIRRRRSFLQELKETMTEIHGELTGGREQIAVSYEMNTDEERFEQELFLQQERELRTGISLVGPHRDDIGFAIDGIDVRRFGSQGQQRTASLSLKLSQIDMIRQKAGENPVLLLDDVLSELDQGRQEHILHHISDIQTLITCTGMDEFIRKNLPVDRVYQVREGRVTGGYHE